MIIVCPSCDEHFDAEEHMLQRITGLYSIVKLIYNYYTEPRLGIFYSSNVVICPYCNHNFRFKEYKYFGILYYSYIHNIIILCYIIFIVFIFFSMIITPLIYIIKSV